MLNFTFGKGYIYNGAYSGSASLTPKKTTRIYRVCTLNRMESRNNTENDFINSMFEYGYESRFTTDPDEAERIFNNFEIREHAERYHQGATFYEFGGKYIECTDAEDFDPEQPLDEQYYNSNDWEYLKVEVSKPWEN